MNAHRFDPLSALLGLIAIAAGAYVASGVVDPFTGSDAGVWITITVLAIGLLMLPWGWHRTSGASRSDDLVVPVVEDERGFEPGDLGR